MHFLILTQYYPPEVGAPQVRLSEMAAALQREGHLVTIVTAFPNYPRGEIYPGYEGRWLMREEIDGVPVIRTWIYPTSGRSVVKRLLSYFSFTFSSLMGLLRAPGPDVIFVESPPLFLGISAFVGGRLRRVPYIINVSDLWPDTAEALGIITNQTFLKMGRWLESLLYRHAWRVCGVTEGIVTVVVRKGVAPEKVMFLPNGVNADRFGPEAVLEPPDTVSSLNGRKVFLYAGTHGYAQGLDVIVEAARLLQDRQDIGFLFVGDGPDKLRVVDLAAEYKLDNIHFESSKPLTAMPQLFASSRASIVPLRKTPLFEGARPSKILSSLACGTPVIYCGEGEAVSLVEGNQAGLCVPPEDPQALAGAVRRLADDTDLAWRLGRNGRQLTEREYGWSDIVSRWLEELGA